MPSRHALSGTTSACAENTSASAAASRAAWNYLRVRGEYLSHDSLREIHMELPPRARRIPIHNENASLTMGTTSACAENTNHGYGLIPTQRNYLRVRGEYAMVPRG